MDKIIITKNDANQRLDKFLIKTYQTLPKSMMFKQIRKKNIKVNKKRCQPEQMLCDGDIVELYLNDDLLIKKVKHYDFLSAPSDINIVYEDENIIILDKKQGQLCHPDKGEYVDTLVTSLKKYLYNKKEYDPEKENTFTPSLANRIDRNTGGLVIGAKNATALRILNDKIKNREIEKYYLTVVMGKMEKKTDILTGYLTKDESKNMVTVHKTEVENSKNITTKYTVLDFYPNVSLLEIQLLTGRTHQIRAHLSSINHPLYGDGKYGKTHGRFRQELFSYKLKFSFKTDGGELEYLNGKEFTSRNCPVIEKFKEKKY